MPLTADPDDTIPYVLVTDRKKKKDEQPKAHIRFQSAKQRNEISKLVRLAHDNDNDDAAMKALSDVFKIGMSRLEKYPPGWTLENLHEHLTIPEMYELAYAIQHEPIITERDRKNSILPVTSDAAATGRNGQNSTPSSSPVAAAGETDAPSVVGADRLVT